MRSIAQPLSIPPSCRIGAPAWSRGFSGNALRVRGMRKPTRLMPNLRVKASRLSSIRKPPMAAGMFRSRWHNVAYRGQTYQIPFSSGGVNYSRNFEEIPSTGMVDPTKNINLFEGGRAKRGGTSHVNDTAISGVSTILGGYQFRLLSGTTFTMFLGDDGGLYKNTTTTIQTGLSTTARPCFETLENELYFFDGQTRPQTWDGAAAGTSNITTPAADWSGTDQPKYVLKHGLGASQRLWAMGVPG